VFDIVTVIENLNGGLNKVTDFNRIFYEINEMANSYNLYYYERGDDVLNYRLNREGRALFYITHNNSSVKIRFKHKYLSDELYNQLPEEKGSRFDKQITYKNELTENDRQFIKDLFQCIIEKAEGLRLLRCWLITWNPQNWKWKEYVDWCVSSKQGINHTMSWSCQSKQPAINDNVFLIKLGEQPRGIIAHGRVVRTYYEAPHYDEKKAAEGKKARRIDVEFDRIQNFESEPILQQDDLKEKFPKCQWSPQGSGIEIKEEWLSQLNAMWNNITNNGGETITMDMNENIKFSHNIILYGPPGTGKTYNTAIYAVSICDGKSVDELTDYNAVMERYKQLYDEHRIAFTTFHQSYGYEEFIEGIKPSVDKNKSDVEYTIASGVFKAFCESARKVHVSDIDNNNGTVWVIRNRAGDKDVDVDFEERLYKESVIKIEDITNYNRQCRLFPIMNMGDWVVLGKGYTINAIGIIADESPEEINDGVFHWQRKVKWLGTNLEYNCKEINGGKYISNFAVAKSRMTVINLQKLVTDKKNEKPYVFIIDEINRGNISKIFGELITLIEDSKREGTAEEACAILPYSGEKFSVPSNVYILGTMNTADRSIALMDTALRRRFDFIEMMPNSDILREKGADKVVADGHELDVAAMLDIINERIAFLYDREHTIGHAFFMGLVDEPSIEKLATIFRKSVVPLLQEYFYDDYQKIQLVLGDNGKTDETHKFIKDSKVVARTTFKGNVDDIIDLPEKKFEINEEAFDNILSYIEIM
jgi:5-methylcytosine-specific restriction protein B